MCQMINCIFSRILIVAILLLMDGIPAIKCNFIYKRWLLVRQGENFNIRFKFSPWRSIGNTRYTRIAMLKTLIFE